MPAVVHSGNYMARSYSPLSLLPPFPPYLPFLLPPSLASLFEKPYFAKLKAAFSGFSVGCCINREKGYLLPT